MMRLEESMSSALLSRSTSKSRETKKKRFSKHNSRRFSGITEISTILGRACTSAMRQMIHHSSFHQTWVSPPLQQDSSDNSNRFVSTERKQLDIHTVPNGVWGLGFGVWGLGCG